MKMNDVVEPLAEENCGNCIRAVDEPGDFY